MFKHLYLVFFFQLFALGLLAQTVLDNRVSGRYKSTTILEILQDFEKQVDVKFYFDPDKLPYYKLNFEFKDVRVLDALNEIFEGKSFAYANFEGNKIVITRRANFNKAYASELVERWEAGEVELPNLNEPEEISLTIGEEGQKSKKRVRFSGRLLDAENRSSIIGATLTTEEGKGTATDANGNFELELTPGEHNISIRYIGYRLILLTLNIYEDGAEVLTMNTNPLELDEVVVKAQAADKNVRSAQIGVEALTPSTIKELPAFLGEADVIKSLETLPGVSSVGDGASGFNVRGGGIDQNLVLQDEALVFNSSHVLGFFSIFNPDVVQAVTLYKGHIPAQYGGRLSSVLDIELKEGNYEKIAVSGGIGLISSRLQVETPIVKGKTSLLLGGRVSYSDWLLKRVELPDARSSSAYFYDGIGKITHQFNADSKLSISYYNSFDFFRFARDFGFEWRTQILNLEWQQIWNSKLSSTTSIIGGDYISSQFDPIGTDAFTLENGLQYGKVKQNFFYNPNEKHAINFGAVATFYDMRPESIRPRSNSSGIGNRTIEKEQAYEIGAYVNDEYTINDKISLALGLRYSWYQNFGADEVFQYQEGAPRTVQNIVDTIRFGTGENIVNYGGLEPRASLKIQLSPNSSVKFSYNRLQQFIHLISNTAVATPVDVWQLSNTFIQPKIANNYSAGLFKNFAGNKWETSIEAYYRSIDNQLDFKDLPSLFLNEHIETELLNGEGRTYGAEFYIKKNLGRWTGWLSYTFSRSETRILANFADEIVNNETWFPAYFDQPHQLTFFTRCEVNQSQTFTANFTYRSGRPITAPIAGYFIGSALIPHYSERNQFRIPDYHRLDLAYTFDNKKAKLKGLKSSFTIAIYNVYFRRNPFSVFFKRDTSNIPQAFQLAVLGSALPSATYNFNF
ncbi:MAG: TonB-dependent receptor [Bacteroidota bacterium]